MVYYYRISVLKYVKCLAEGFVEISDLYHRLRISTIFSLANLVKFFIIFIKKNFFIHMYITMHCLILP